MGTRTRLFAIIRERRFRSYEESGDRDLPRRSSAKKILLVFGFSSFLVISAFTFAAMQRGHVPSHAAPGPVPFLCTGTASLCSDFIPTPVSLLSTTFTSQTANARAPSYAWDFGDGTTGSGNPVRHSYALPSEYLVKLTVTDGANTFSVSHDVTELGSLPSSEFTPPSASSINPYVNCNASVTTIPGIIGTVANANGGADLSGALTTSILMKHTLAYPCTVFGYSVFVELHNLTVTYGPFTTTDCTNLSSTGSSCDVVGNIADGAGYMHMMRWEVERYRSASGQVAQFGDVPQTGQHIDAQGFVFWSFLAPADSLHDFSGWYLELTGWKPTSSTSSQPPPPPSTQPPPSMQPPGQVQPPFWQSCQDCATVTSWIWNFRVLLVTGFLLGLFATLSVGKLRGSRESDWVGTKRHRP